jgi:hypothetical protein
MNLPAQLVYNTLLGMGVRYLFHCNTVTTACSFAYLGGLVSRESIEKYGLTQTWQRTDSTDKRFRIWDDIFLDSVDIHARVSNINFYGPVLFKMKLDLLLHPKLPEIWITKSNPSKWSKSGPSYFSSIQEFQESYCMGTFDYIITIRNNNFIVYFQQYLEKIIIDNPDKYIGTMTAFDYAKSKMTNCAAQGGNYNFPPNMIIPRNDPGCSCHPTYQSMDQASFNKFYI